MDQEIPKDLADKPILFKKAATGFKFGRMARSRVLSGSVAAFKANTLMQGLGCSKSQSTAAKENKEEN